jgi:beta-N-acetylhexosaminidase
MKITFSSICLTIFIFMGLKLCAFQSGQMIITGFRGTASNNVEVKALKRKIDQKKIGGVIIYKRNVKTKSQLTELIQYLSSETPIFVAIDHEGGVVNRLTHDSFNLNTPSPQTFCALPRHQQGVFAQQLTETLNAIGVNMNFGGVVDIAPLILPSSVCMYNRCFSNTQEKVLECTTLLFEQHKNHGIFYAYKHFPGHGSTPVDSHYDLPNITKTHSEYDYMPYYNLGSNEPLKMVMVGHLINETVDSNMPASLSKSHIDMLKNTFNFKGLIITDDLNMGALQQVVSTPSELAVLAAKAGNHLLLFEYLTLSDIDAVNQALELESNANRDFLIQVSAAVEFIQSQLISVSRNASRGAISGS